MKKAVSPVVVGVVVVLLVAAMVAVALRMTGPAPGPPPEIANLTHEDMMKQRNAPRDPNQPPLPTPRGSTPRGRPGG